MPGPPPKNPENRRRRNPPSRGEWRDLPTEPFKGKRAPLPRRKGGLLAATKVTWTEWWSSPMAHCWLEADWSMLQIAIGLCDTLNRRMAADELRSPNFAAEYRRYLDALGLTEKGRRDLRWRIPGDVAWEEAPIAPVIDIASRTPSRRRPDPRQVSG